MPRRHVQSSIHNTDIPCSAQATGRKRMESKIYFSNIGSHSYLTILESKQREESTCTLLYSFDNVLTILLLYPIIYTYTLLNQTSPLLFNPKGGARDTGSPYCKAWSNKEHYFFPSPSSVSSRIGCRMQSYPNLFYVVVMVAGTIYTLGWRDTTWRKVSCLILKTNR